MQSAVLGSFPLEMHWPTLDPFLFCAHHNDNYPPAKQDMSPAADLAGRNIGMDFASLDGWNMYHGAHVPGFPVHPHRGFETITYVRQGFIDHSDSLGAAARFGSGDVQWVTAGSGLQHSEMFPLFNESQRNPLELFQIWLNLPAASKMVDGYFTMMWRSSLQTVSDTGGNVTVLAGSFAGAQAEDSPPDSWAASPNHDVNIWHIVLEPGGKVNLPTGPNSSNRAIYFFDGQDVRVNESAGETEFTSATGAQLDPTLPVTLTSQAGAELLLLQGQPIGEPVVQHGPFVMNSKREIMQAMADYQQTQFGGWPWPEPDHVHDKDEPRFAVFPDGSRVEPD